MTKQISNFQWHVSQEDTDCHNILLTNSHFVSLSEAVQITRISTRLFDSAFQIVISDFYLFAATKSHFPLLTTELALVRKSPRVSTIIVTVTPGAVEMSVQLVSINYSLCGPKLLIRERLIVANHYQERRQCREASQPLLVIYS